MNPLRQSRSACAICAFAIGAIVGLFEWNAQAGYCAYLAHIASRAPTPEMRDLASRRLEKLLMDIPEFAHWVKEGDEIPKTVSEVVEAPAKSRIRAGTAGS